MSGIEPTNLSPVTSEQVLLESPEAAYGVVLITTPPAEGERIGDDRSSVALNEKPIEKRDVSADLSAENKKARLLKQKEIVRTITEFLCKDTSMMSTTSFREGVLSQKDHVEEIKNKLSTPKAMAEFAKFIMELEICVDFPGFKIDDFISSLDSKALDVLLGVMPGRNVYLGALKKWALSLTVFSTLVHSPKFGAFHRILTSEIPIIQQFIASDSFYGFEELWTLFGVPLCTMNTSSQQIPASVALFQKIAQDLGIELWANGPESVQLTALHFLGAHFFGHLESVGNLGNIKKQIFAALTPPKSSSASPQLDMDKVYPILKAFQNQVAACQLLENEPAD
jgi:hypothetical protein